MCTTQGWRPSFREQNIITAAEVGAAPDEVEHEIFVFRPNIYTGIDESLFPSQLKGNHTDQQNCSTMSFAGGAGEVET